MRGVIPFGLGMLLSLTPLLSARGAELPPDASPACAALQGAAGNIPEATTLVMSASIVAAAGDTPAYCRVVGSVQPSVGFELRLPVTAWNGKFAEYGCGSRCGGAVVSNGCEISVRRGYACITTDMGHKGPGSDSTWGLDNLYAEADYGFRATHVATVAGKALSQKYYGRAARHAYFYGCSTGGRQGLIEAQYFPWDFDGIISGAPVPDGNALLLAWNALAALDANGNSVLNADDLRLVNRSVIKLCDRNDGVVDGLIGDPRACGFDVRRLACGATPDPGRCLTPPQIRAVQRLYQGPVDSSGKRLTVGRALPGSELNWFGYLAGANATAATVEIPGSPPVRATNYYRMENEQFRYLQYWPDPGPDYDISQINWDEDYKRQRLMDLVRAPTNVDLREFKALGGRIIAYQGWDDSASLPESIVDYYETVTKTMDGLGPTQDFFRLFMLPGMAHCVGGAGAAAVDYLTALENWVEKGQPPDRLLASHLEKDAVSSSNQYVFPLDKAAIAFTRPVFPYPQRARYSGRGDATDAASYRAEGPVKPAPRDPSVPILHLERKNTR